MSAWTTSVTKLATAKAVWSFSKVLFDLTYGATVYPHLDPDGKATGWDRQTEWTEVAEDLNWEEPEDEPGGLFKVDMERKTNSVAGLEAIFFFIKAVWSKKVEFTDCYDEVKIRDSTNAIMAMVAPSTQATMSKFIEATAVEDKDYANTSKMFMNASDAILLAKTSAYWSDLDEEYFPKGAAKWSGNFVVRRVKGLLLLMGTDFYANKVLVFSDATATVLISVLDRLASMFDDVGRRYAKRPDVLVKFNKLMDNQIVRSSELSGGAANKVCAAWHEVRTYIQYSVLNSIMTEAVDSVRDEYVTSGYTQVIPLLEAVELVSHPDKSITMDLIHTYKWIPPPEYDTTKALPIIRDLHMATRVSGASPNASDENKAIYKDIQTERKVNILSAYYRQNRFYPPDLVKKKDIPTFEEIENWEAKNVFKYESLGTQIANQVKDKTTVCASMETEIHGRKDMFSQNYLMWYLANWEKVDTKVWLDDFSKGVLSEDNYARVAYKGEAQKEYSRPFFILPPKLRTILGEFEGNLSRVARYYPAVLMGKPQSAQDALMDVVMDPFTPASEDVLQRVTTTFIIMFDVSKWSPKSDGNQVAEYHDFWAKVYGDDRLRSLSAIGCKSKILNTTDGVIFSYQNEGADLEGFRGRMGSMYHADLLATACRRSVKKKFIAGKSNLVVFIDDGAVKIEAIGEGEEAKSNARKFLEEMKAVYTAGGQEIHTRKVVISEIGGEILANFYLNGVRVPQGIKAAMKMIPDYSNPVATLPEHIDSAFASAQGALKSGTDIFTTYARYVKNSLIALHKMNRHALAALNPHQIALMAITPKSMGGLGIQSLQGLCSTTVSNMTCEGLSMLNRVGRAYPNLRKLVGKIINTPIMKREPLAILRDPIRVRTNTPAMVESRLVKYVMEELMSKVPVFAKLVGGVSAEVMQEQANEVAKALLESGSVSVPILNKAWKATPLCEVETVISKFKRSDAIITMIGYSGVKKIRERNISDVKKVVDTAKFKLV